MNHEEGSNRYVLEMNVADDGFGFTASIETAITSAETEIQNLEETILSLENLKPNCDKLDYALAASIGALCGLLDIFLVGKPGESPAQDITDEWFAKRTIDFAKRLGWEEKSDNQLASAIRYLENNKKYRIPYDQCGTGDSASSVDGLNPTNHHFKSLGHNPSIIGLFYSILDQFTNQSHFVSDGELISLQKTEEGFELRGHSLPAKMFAGFVNWFVHLISDMSGASGSKGRGMGIPSPFWTWTNDVIVIKQKLNIPVSQFDKDINELAMNIFNKGYDARFQAAQIIPVFINEMIVRFVYAIRRQIKYISTTKRDERSAAAMWKACEPFTNPNVKRLLTVAHGSFCMIDLSDATIRAFITGGGVFTMEEFVLRLNILEMGRFMVSLYGEGKQAIVLQKAKSDSQFLKREKDIVENYLCGLSLLSEIYDDSKLVDFVADFRNSDMYIQAFQKSVQLAETRKVPDNKILKEKSDIDKYFRGE